MDETSFLCNEGELKVLGIKDNPTMKNCIESRLSITVLWVWIVAGVNGPVIFMEKGTNVHPRIIVNNLVTRYGFPEGSCVILNKPAYMDGETWMNGVKLVATGIRKTKVSNVACVFPILFSIYLTLHLTSSRSQRSFLTFFLQEKD